MSEMESPEHRLASFTAGLAFQDIPEQIRHAAKRAILNVMATMLAGSAEPAVGKALEVLHRRSAQGNAMLAGRAMRTEPLLAAFINAIAANIHDFDDTHMPTILHPSSPVLPALMAASSETAIDGKDLIRGFVAGVEVECRIGRAISPYHYDRGWHITSTCGVFGSAAAVAAIRRLTPRQGTAALSCAAVQAGGMVEALGTDAKSISVGNAARNGIVAAELAAMDFGGPSRPMTGERGFLNLYAQTPDPTPIEAALGEQWELNDVAYKPYPVGVVLNPVVDAALELRARGVEPDAIDSIAVRGHPLLRQRTDRPDVSSGRLAQVSAQHAFAVALLRGRAGLAEFTDEAVRETVSRRPPFQFIDEEERDPSSIAIEVKLRSGEVLAIDIPAGRGSPRNPMRDGDIERKLKDCAAIAGLESRAGQIIDTVWRLEQLDDARQLADLCRPWEKTHA